MSLAIMKNLIKSNLNKEDLTSFDKIKQNIEKIKQLNDSNSEDSKKLEQQIQKI